MQTLTDKEQDLLESKMTALIKSKVAKVLCDDMIPALTGKRIQTMFFGYKGQNGVDDFIVGEVKQVSYPGGYVDPPAIFTQDGRNTFIRAATDNDGAFTCSDSDRFVYFIQF